MRKGLKKAIYIFLAISCIVFGLAWHLLPGIILCPYRLNAEENSKDFPRGIYPEDYDYCAEDFNVLTADSIWLDGYFIHSNTEPAKATVIMLHGIGSCKEAFLSRAGEFIENNCNVILMDLRAQGQSGGSICTYGFLEKYDISRVAAQAYAMDPNTPVGVLGVSLGGAIAYQAMGIDTTIRFGIVESTFDEMRNVVREYTSRFAGFRANLLADFAIWRAESEAKIEVENVSPRKSAYNIRVPVFVSHGDADENIPLALGWNNYKALPNPESVFNTVNHAGHNDMLYHSGSEYHKRLLEFIDSAVR